MEKQFSKYCLNSLTSYFSVLSKFGYKNYNDVYKLILVLFIEEILHGNYIDFIEEKDYKVISNVLTCILGTSCLLPYPKYIKNIGDTNNTISLFRLHEDSINKITENLNFRIM